ncbi:MAG: hypothetical protein ACOVRN_01745 [Flavobacterium sp.]
MNIDDEWENFISSALNEDDDSVTSDLSEDMSSYMNTYLGKEVKDDHSIDLDMEQYADPLSHTGDKWVTPKASDMNRLYISTKTKIAYLNRPFELNELFWSLPVIPYSLPQTGVIKKQMKFNSTTKEEVDYIQSKLTNQPYYEEYVITHIDNPSSTRIKYKDIRKVSIGVSKKDIMSYRCKQKSAFYNCFVIILRMKHDDRWKEYHVKVFNTGKLEIPGIQTDEMLQMILNEVVKTLQPYVDTQLAYKPDSEETVLINSNFNCGFFINRDALYEILKNKYNIQAIYDPCSYPGIQCKFYYNPTLSVQTGCLESRASAKDLKKVSFMIFRTGSVLIVGKCDENVLIVIYEYLKNILCAEFQYICHKHMGSTIELMKEKNKKPRRKNITVEFSSERESDSKLGSE